MVYTEEEMDETENEWRDILYYLIDAIGGKRGKSIPEDVEWAKIEIERLKENQTKDESKNK